MHQSIPDCPSPLASAGHLQVFSSRCPTLAPCKNYEDQAIMCPRHLTHSLQAAQFMHLANPVLMIVARIDIHKYILNIY